ncbi:MAG TPA: thiol reductant ABC exporter subunit CydC, partial [Mycobacterium sp.]|nr:thiol reductant ABC exporter subunit CydC [Mycobacterium sp.]
AAELRISGRLPEIIAESQRRQRDWGSAADAAAAPAAWAAAMPTAATAVSVLGAVVAGIAIAPTVAPTTLAILMLLPLSAFEATTTLPGAAVQLTRSRIAAQRLFMLAPSDGRVPSTTHPVAGTPPAATRRLHAENVRTGHHAERSSWVTLDLEPGARLAVTGPSGTGKTTLLMTLAGLITPLHGRVELDGVPVDQFSESELRANTAFFAEDAHTFATTVRDNLLVVRGDCTDDELVSVLDRVGLGGWLAGLPDGLNTVLSGGAQAVSAGQRRRLLLARAVLSPARIILLDEPTEHLDVTDTDRILHDLLNPDGGLFTADRTVVVATHHLPGGMRCRQLSMAGNGALAPVSPATK